jgi:hypothetical protein
MHPTTPSEQLHAKREVALQTVARLLRVCGPHEPEAWLAHYEELYVALRDGRDEDAFGIVQEGRRVDSSGVPKWLASGRLAEDVRQAVARLRTHVRYGDQRPPLTLSPNDPDIEAEGAREQQLEKQLAGQGIHPGLPIVGLPVSQLVQALAAIESAKSPADKRVMSVRVQKDGSLLVNTGEQVGPLAGGGNILVLKRMEGRWVMTHQGEWVS